MAVHLKFLHLTLIDAVHIYIYMQAMDMNRMLIHILLDISSYLGSII